MTRRVVVVYDLHDVGTYLVLIISALSMECTRPTLIHYITNVIIIMGTGFKCPTNYQDIFYSISY